jgi:hypothetical protein
MTSARAAVKLRRATRPRRRFACGGRPHGFGRAEPDARNVKGRSDGHEDGHEVVDDTRTPSSGVGASEEIILAAARDWPNAALGGIVAHYEVAIVGKARQEGRQAFFHRSFLARLSLRATHASQTRHARMGETATAAPIRRRGLVHACHIVIQNRREPTLDLRDAHAADVTSLSVYGGWVRRSRRAVLRW